LLVPCALDLTDRLAREVTSRPMHPVPKQGARMAEEVNAWQPEGR